MVKKRFVTWRMPEKFFDILEEGRVEEQQKLRNNPKLGSGFNLTQNNFAEMLVARKFKFTIPPQKPLIEMVMRKSRSRRRKK